MRVSYMFLYREMNDVRCGTGILHTLNELIADYIKAKCTVSSQSGVHVFFYCFIMLSYRTMHICLYANTIAL
jgi:hypothetical protein